ncbi:MULTISPECIES: hypothetical protein [Pseudomonas]|uniref:Uncharacterized protein n=1 Tax=Pseudomonas cichorii TaxID=36746 RepID=A0ABQ1DSG3_PSECI|nr:MULTISPECIES: hypothetical protein [Pseudomonas]QVE14907.1 hypothetical protein KGD89_13315 [Pseudomonas cichorii]GFM76906.1 hypothetical protein PSCICM_27250 [Pseudomonas cichorii]GFM93973.1 hypothetical protein PSCICP_39450 [Pseudomonas cichorii]
MIDILVEVVFRAVCYFVGWPVMKALTLGKYPVKGSLFAETAQATLTSLIGIAVLAITVLAILM